MIRNEGPHTIVGTWASSYLATLKYTVKMTVINFKHIKILTLLAVLFLSSAPSLVPVPSISNVVLPYNIVPFERISVDAHGRLRCIGDD